MEMSELERVFDELGIEGAMPSVKALATVLNVPYQRLRNVAKKPEEGVVYTANFTNYWALTRYINLRLNPDGQEGDGTFATLDDVILAAVEKDKELKVRTFLPAGERTITLDDGTEIVARRHDYQVGDVVRIRGEKDKEGQPLNREYEVAYFSKAFVCLKEVNGETLRVMSNATMNAKAALLDPNQTTVEVAE